MKPQDQNKKNSPYNPEQKVQIFKNLLEKTKANSVLYKNIIEERAQMLSARIARKKISHVSYEKKSKIPYIFVAFFAVVIAVNGVYIYLSKKTWKGVATDHAYQKGLKYNEVIKQSKEQKKLGWDVKLDYHPTKDRAGYMLITVRDRENKVIQNAQVSIIFKRPDREDMDFTTSIYAINGIYKGEIEFPLKGQWDAELTIRQDDIVIKQLQRFVIN